MGAPETPATGPSQDLCPAEHNQLLLSPWQSSACPHSSQEILGVGSLHETPKKTPAKPTLCPQRPQATPASDTSRTPQPLPWEISMDITSQICRAPAQSWELSQGFSPRLAPLGNRSLPNLSFCPRKAPEPLPQILPRAPSPTASAPSPWLQSGLFSA